MNSEKVCLYTARFIREVNDYFSNLVDILNDTKSGTSSVFSTYLDTDGKFSTYMTIAARIGLNKNVHDDIIQIDGTHEGFSQYKTRGEYTSITQKFKDWKHLTLMVDKAINEITEYIAKSTKYTNSKNFMQGPKSTFKIQADIERMKKAFCVTNKRGELNMSLNYERNAAEILGGRRSRRNRKNKNRKSRRR